MARVIIDTCIFGDKWFKETLDKLIDDDKVQFTYTSHEKMMGEHENAPKLLAFYKRMGDRNRRIDAAPDATGRHMAKIEGHPEWQAAPECDDPHMFAIVYLKPTRYIFSKDTRMAKCRDCMNKHINGKYCNFRIISSKKVYEQLRNEIHS